jgi:ribosomal protein L13
MLRKLKIYAGPGHPHAAQFRASDKEQESQLEKNAV